MSGAALVAVIAALSGCIRTTDGVATWIAGPDGLTGMVTIAATTLDPAAAFADGPPGTRAFADRITHIWTNTDKYLVATHLEGPADTPGFDAAKTALMQDFAVVIP